MISWIHPGPPLAVAALLLGSAPSISAQQGGWNDPRPLEMVREARALRQGQVVDPELRSYASQARGFVYFFLDREDTGERVLVKTDQIALEVYWRAPNLTRQRIVGLRDEKSLPTNIQYHLDHLLVVQDEFGDRIRIGDGDEVEAVVHPVAPGSEEVYDFLLADSVSLILQGGADTVRVYEIQVRPRDFDSPAFVGSLYLDRDTRAIVRMSFTFTPSSYVDEYLDHIQISLENGLWLGRHWLPYRQELEIRREVPYLDIPAGSIIRGWFEIRDYQLNPPLPPTFFQGPTVTALPEAVRRAFPFEDSLHAQLEKEGSEGLRPPPSMEEIRALAVEIARERYLSGLGTMRLSLPSPMVSSVLRYNRSEGLFLGGGLSYGVSPGLGLAGYGGFSLGRERPELRVALTGGERHPSTRVEGYWNRPRDLGPVPAISGALNTLTALVLERDYRDLTFASGARAVHAWRPREGWRVEVEGRWEEHEAARDVVSSDPLEPHFRPVLPAEEGTWRSLSVSTGFPTLWPSLRGDASLMIGRFHGRDMGEISGTVRLDVLRPTRGWELRGDVQGGALLGNPPIQAHAFLGGRETVPGHPFRSQVGDRHILARGEFSREALHPWVRLRALASLGHAWGEVPLPGGVPWDRTEASLLGAVGAGAGLGWDVLRLDLFRGLGRGGDWELILGVNHAFWDWL